MPRVIYSTNGKYSRIPNGSYMEHVFAEHITILCSYLMGMQAIDQAFVDREKIDSEWVGIRNCIQ